MSAPSSQAIGRVAALLLACALTFACRNGAERSDHGPDLGDRGSGNGESNQPTSPTSPPTSPVTPTATPASAPPAPEAREERAVFDLGANRLLAHLRVGESLHLSGASAGFASYVHFSTHRDPGWLMGLDRDGVTTVEPEPSSKRAASLDVPVTSADAKAFKALAMRIHAQRPHYLAVKLNGRDKADIIGRFKLEPGWQTVTVPIPPGRLKVGENRFSFGPSRSPHSFAWLRFGRAQDLAALDTTAAGGDAPGADAPDLALPRYDRATRSFLIPDGSGLDYYVYAPQSGYLVADIASEGAGVDRAGQSCALNVRIDAHEDSQTATLRGPGARLSLKRFVDKVVRLQLRATGCATLRLGQPRLTVAGEAPELKRGPKPKYVVLWVMDTLRADRVRPFQPDARPEVPVFTRLAESGAVFRQYWVQGNESQTSHASVWTSLYPKNHNVRTAGNGGSYRMEARFEKLPKQMREAGFFTIGVTANGYVTKYGRYGEDFEVWRNLMREGIAVKNSIPSDKIVDISLEYFKENYENGPVFLFIGTIDTHKPWIGRQPWLDRYDTEPYKGKHKEAAWPGDLGLKKGSMKCVQMPKKRDLKRINAIYDSNVSFQDAELGRFLETLKDWGIADQTMLIVTADHGEELWEVGRCGHGASLRETLTRVPLLIHYPPYFPGRVVMEGAEGVDIIPTVLDVLERPTFADAQGHSLVPLAQGVTGGYPMPSYASQYEYAHAMRLASWKYRVGRPGGIELYDLGSDPEEMKDMNDKRPIERRFMADAMLLFLQYRGSWNKRIWGVASNMRERAACELSLHFGVRPEKSANKKGGKPGEKKNRKPGEKKNRDTDGSTDGKDAEPDPCAPVEEPRSRK